MSGHGELADEQTKPRNYEAESHQGKARSNPSNPSEKRPLGGQIVTRRSDPSFRHRRSPKRSLANTQLVARCFDFDQVVGERRRVAKIGEHGRIRGVDRAVGAAELAPISE